MPHELFQRALGRTTLLDALKQLPASHTQDLIALLYSPRTCQFARYKDGALIGHDGASLGDDVFEARLFSPRLELRWLQSGVDSANRRLGDGVVLHEDSELGGEPRPGIVSVIPGQYLLWGQGVSPQSAKTPGWSMLTAARIARLPVPFPAVPERLGRLVLKVLEYVACDPDHGNCFIAEERLLKLELYRGEATHA